MKAMKRNEIAKQVMVGARISGWYMGQAFNGVVAAERPTYGQDMSYTIKLDSNIFPFGSLEDPRREILLDLDQMEQCGFAMCDSCDDDVTIDCHDCEQHQEAARAKARDLIWELQTLCNTSDLGFPELQDALNNALGEVWDLANGRNA